LIGVSIYLVRFSPVMQYFTIEQRGLVFEAAGFWAPLLFVFIYAAGICLFFPGCWHRSWYPCGHIHFLVFHPETPENGKGTRCDRNNLIDGRLKSK
jgi:hypothetical protein